MQPNSVMSNSNFNTPPEIITLVKHLDMRGIGLDPCWNDLAFTDAHTYWGGADCPEAPGDGLSQQWRGHGLVFMNPPHSKSPHNIEPWIAKAYCEFVQGVDWTFARDHHDPQDQFVGLVPAKTDTAWFHDFVVPFPVKVFMRGRPKFWLDGAPMTGPGKFASMLIYAGRQPDRFVDLCESLGWVVA